MGPDPIQFLESGFCIGLIRVHTWQRHIVRIKLISDIPLADQRDGVDQNS